MRLIRLAVLLALFSLPLVVAPRASALDLCDEARCQPPPAEQNSPYEFRFRAEEGCLPYRFSFSSGTVPPGLRVTEDGKLTGTPTEAGTFEFYVALDDASGLQNVNCLVPSKQSQGRFRLTVLPDLYVATSSLPAAVAGSPYSTTLQAANPENGWPLLWDITQGTLPAGLSLSESGVVSGTPTGADSKTVTIRVREPFRRSGERQLTLVVAARLVLDSSPPLLGRVGVPFARSLSATGGTAPLAWSVAAGALPPGLALETATGAIRGTPRAAGAYALTFAVTDASGQRASGNAVARILPRLRITTLRLAPAVVGRAYRTQLGTTGLLRFGLRWSVVAGSLPRGIRLGRGTGLLAGTPHRAGTYRFVVRAEERASGTAQRAFVLIVRG